MSYYRSNNPEEFERAKCEARTFKMVAGLDSKNFEKGKGYLKDINNDEYSDKTK